MGTITTYSYCVTKNNVAWTGTKSEIINQICKFSFDSKGRLKYTFKGYPEQIGISFSDEFTPEEISKETIKFLFQQLTAFRYRIFRDIGF